MLLYFFQIFQLDYYLEIKAIDLFKLKINAGMRLILIERGVLKRESNR